MGHTERDTSKQKASVFIVRWAMVYAMFVSQFSFPLIPAAYANPSGGNVTHGSATISGQGTSSVTIKQSSSRAVINWNNFSVGAGEKTTFVQPGKNSVAFNRVTGTAPSQILGSVSANGKIIISNSNGVIFGKGSKVDAAGLVATTHDADSNAFMSGGPLRFNGNGGNAAVVNEGTITIKDSGVAAFVAPSVRNAGVITADLGKVAMGAGKGFTLDLYGDSLVSFAVGDEITQTLTTADGVPIKALVENSGAIQASGGQILLTATAARDVMNQAVNVTGSLKANSATKQGGKIILSSSNRSGQASGVVKVEDGAVVSATGKTAGGTVHVLGQNIEIQKATIDVTGQAGGGAVRIGGDKRGASSLMAADKTVIGSQAVIKADAVKSGKGGEVVVWADKDTDYKGSISARGGSSSGDGGFIEVSGKETLIFKGGIDLAAPKGGKGTLLLDPSRLWITDKQETQDVDCNGSYCTGPAPSFLNVQDLEGLLAVANVYVESDFITVESSIYWSTDSLLMLNATADIMFENGAKIANDYAGEFSSDRIPVLLALRANSDSKDDDGMIDFANGVIDFSKSTGAVSIFYDAAAGLNMGAMEANSDWTAPENHTVSSQFTAYQLVHSMEALMAALSNDAGGTYALGSALDANDYDKHTPVEKFAGIVDGQYCVLMGGSNCSIHNLHIAADNGGESYGLFGSLEETGILRNLEVGMSMEYMNQSAGKYYISPLVGVLGGTLANVHLSAMVRYMSEANNAETFLGGFAGYKGTTGSIYNSGVNLYVEAEMKGKETMLHLGGIAGMAEGAGSKGDPTGIFNTQSQGQMQVTAESAHIGGLVGTASGGLVIESSQANPRIQAHILDKAVIGGLVGDAADTVIKKSSNSSTMNIDTGEDASYLAIGGIAGILGDGSVQQTDGQMDLLLDFKGSSEEVFVGGLVGISEGLVENSYATGSLSASVHEGRLVMGGLVGYLAGAGEVLTSFSAGRLTGIVERGADVLGGLVSINRGRISDSYSVTVVYDSKNESAIHGGFVGINDGSIANSFSTGYIERAKDSSGTFGGFVGLDRSGDISRSYWDMETSGIKDESSRAGGVTTRELQSRLSWDESVWGIIEGYSYPYLNWQIPKGEKGKPQSPQVIAGYAYDAINGNALVDKTVYANVDGYMIGSLANGHAYTGANGYYYYLLAPGTMDFEKGAQVATYLENQTGIHFHDMTRDNIGNATIFDGALYMYTNETLNSSQLTQNMYQAFWEMDTAISHFDTDKGSLTMAEGYNLVINWDKTGDRAFIDNAFDVSKGTLHLITTDQVNQTAAFNAANLFVEGGDFYLQDGSNRVDTLAGEAHLLSYNANSHGLTVLDSHFNSLYLNSTGSVYSDASLYAGNLLLMGANGNYNFQGYTTIGNIAAETGSISLANYGSTINIGSVGGIAGVKADNFFLSSTSGASQTAGLRAANVYLAGASTFNLNNSANAITTLAGNVGTLSFTENSGFEIGSVNGANGLTASNVYLSSTGTVTQSRGIVAPNLLLNGTGGVFNLTSASNAITTLAGNVGTGTINFLENSGFEIGSVGGTVGVTAANLYLSSGASVTQQQRISATNLLLGGAGGSYTLLNSGNVVSKLAASTGDISFRGSGGYEIGSVNNVDGFTVNSAYLFSIGTVTQTQRISADKLRLSGGSTGVFNLTHAGNAVNTLAASAGTINFLENSGFEIGSVDGTVGVTATNVYLSSAGNVTQQQRLSATNLHLGGTGAYALTGSGNNIGTISANTGSLSLNNGGNALTVGSVNSVSGVTTTGATSMVNAGLITLNQGVTAGGAGTSITLSGTGFDNNAGANALNAGAGGGRFLVWSATPLSDDRGGIAHAFKQYNATYGVTTVLGSGSGFLYTLAPTVSTSLQGTVTKQYDATTAATLTGANYGAVTGAVDGDTVTLTNPTAGTYDSANAGGGKTVSVGASTVNTATNGAVTVYGYQVGATPSAIIGQIDKRVLTIDGNFTANNKQYDATTGATFLANGLTLVGVQNSEDVSLSGATIAFADANKGDGKIVSLTGGSLAGSADLDNYTLSFTGAPTTTADIAARVLTIDGNFTANNKQYDATTGATFLANGLTLVGVQNSEDVSLSGATIAFADANKGDGKIVSLTGGSLAGSADLDNYTLSFTGAPTTTADIAARVLTIDGNFTANNKQYDATTGATFLANGLTLVGVQNSEDVSLSGATIAFADANKGDGKIVSLTGGSLAGSADLDNYTLSFTGAPTTTADIAARVLTIDGNFTANNKQYDATTGATFLANGLTLVGVQNSEDVNLSGATITFADANKGDGKIVSLTGGSLAGSADLDNYTLSFTGAPTTTADIAARVLTIDGNFTANSKTFDNNTHAVIGTNGLTLLGIQNGENVTLNTVASFDSAAVGSGKTVNLTGSSLGGTANLSNYTLSFANAPTATANVASAAPPPPVVTVTPEVQTVILTLANPAVTQPATPKPVIMDNPSAPQVTTVVAVAAPDAAPAAKKVTSEPVAESKKESAGKESDTKGGGKTICPQNVRRDGEGSEISISCSRNE